MVGAETTSSGKLFHWLMTLCVKQSTLLFVEFQMVASGVGCWVESKQIRPINDLKTSQKFIGFNHVATLSLTIQRINSKFFKSCFIWQICQSRYKFSCSPLYPFQGINILCQVWAPKLDTIL